MRTTGKNGIPPKPESQFIYDADFEGAAIGSYMVGAIIGADIDESCFFLKRNKTLLKLFRELKSKPDAKIDYLLLRKAINDRGLLEEVGGDDYVFNKLPSYDIKKSNIGYYEAELIKLRDLRNAQVQILKAKEAVESRDISALPKIAENLSAIQAGGAGFVFLNNTEPEQADFCAERAAGNFKCFDGKTWYAYDPERGIFTTDNAKSKITQLVEQCAAERFDPSCKDPAVLNFVKALNSKTGIANVLWLLSYKEKITALPAQFDSNPYLLNCRGITVDLRTGEQRASTPADLHTKSTLCKPEPGPCPKFQKFLDENTCGDAELKNYKLRFYGYCLTGVIKEGAFLDCYGSGTNGKSKEINTVAKILGNYAGVIPEGLIIIKPGAYTRPPETSYSCLRGIRFAYRADVPAGRLNMDEIKQITGDDPVTGRELYCMPHDFKPQAKIVIGTNHKLSLSETTEAIRSRVRLVPFKFKPKIINRNLADELLEEAPQILNLLIEEAKIFLNIPPTADPFPHCSVVEKETESYINSQDIVENFLNETYSRDAGASVPSKEVWESYKAWTLEANVRTGKRADFFEKLKNKGIETAHNRTGSIVQGLRTKRCDEYLSHLINSSFTRVNEKLPQCDEYSSQPAPPGGAHPRKDPPGGGEYAPKRNRGEGQAPPETSQPALVSPPARGQRPPYAGHRCPACGDTYDENGICPTCAREADEADYEEADPGNEINEEAEEELELY